MILADIIKNMSKNVIGGLVIPIVLSLNSCPDPDINNKYGEPDPAAVYCEGLGYKYKIMEDGMKNQYGVCVFPDKNECREWSFFKGKCGNNYSFCETNGGEISTITDQNCPYSHECANCTLPGGNECFEWDYFNGECP